MVSKYYFTSPIGILCLEEENGKIIGLNTSANTTPSTHTPSPLIKDALTQLTDYFNGKRTSFMLPLDPHGTAFQERVWAALRKIPYGETRSYKDIAIAIGQPKATRAIGGANNKNPILILIPCHRVIGANGSLVGFGCGLDVKEYLLQLEQRNTTDMQG